MTINTVIFDLDGTLLYTLDDLTDSVNNILVQHGFHKRTKDEIKRFVGNGVPKLIERVVPNGADNPLYEDCLKEFKSDYQKNMFNKTKPYDGIINMLTNLKKREFKTAVLSNKFDDAVKGLCDKYFKGLIDISIGQHEGVEKKPSPDGIELIIKELNSEKENCILVGDSDVDIQTAQNSEIPCISVVWGYKDIDFLYKSGAEVIIYSPDELPELI